MNKSTILKVFIALFALAFITPNVSAQSKADKKKEKKERKRVKKKLKSYMKDTESYSNMIDGYKENIETLESEVDETTEKNVALRSENKALNDSVMSLINEITDLTFQLEEAKGSTIFSNEGVEYRVQIGAYKSFDLSPFLTDKQVIGYELVDGMYHYFIGSWKSADEAYDFAQEFNKLNIDDAFVTKYVDGNRVDFDYLNQ